MMINGVSWCFMVFHGVHGALTVVCFFMFSPWYSGIVDSSVARKIFDGD